MQGRALDEVLAQGWYRGGDHVFTTDHIYYDQNVEPGLYPVFWLRYNLAKLEFTKTMRRLIKSSQELEVAFVPYVYSDEYEDLYSKYKMLTKFTSSLSLLDYLTGNFGHTGVEQLCIFDTYAVTIRKNNQLIGAGITDMGSKSMSGIMNFFDPDYHKLSLGKMLVIHKVAVALQKQMRFFYPGYIAPGISAFDYKTFIGTSCIEVWDFKRQVWVEWSKFKWPPSGPMKLL